MAIDYTSFAIIAKSLIDESGRSIIVRKIDRTLADANKPWEGPTNTEVGGTDHGVIGVFVPLNSAVKLGLSIDAATALVKRVDQVVMFAPGNDVTLIAENFEEYDEIVDGSEVWKIVMVEKLRPGTITLIYFFGVRR